MTDKLCVDCKHYLFNDRGHWNADKHWCTYPFKPPLKDMITGDIIKPPLSNCYKERSSEGTCGPEANLYQPKDKQ